MHGETVNKKNQLMYLLQTVKVHKGCANVTNVLQSLNYTIISRL